MVALAGSLVSVGSAEAQRLIPQIGLYVPVSDLGHVGGLEGAVELGKKESSRAYGLGLEWGAGGSIGLRGNLAYATASAVPLAGIDCLTCSSRTSMAAVTGGVVLRAVSGCSSSTPTCSRERDSSATTSPVTTSKPGSTWSWTTARSAPTSFAVGGELGLGILQGIVEISDYVSEYRPEGLDPQRRHDFIVTIGLGFGS